MSSQVSQGVQRRPGQAKGKAGKSQQRRDIEKVRLDIIHVFGETKQIKTTAKRLGVSPNTVRLTIQKYQEQGTIDDSPRSGRPRITSSRTDALIVRSMKAEPFQSVKQLNESISQDIRPSERTTNRRLHEAGLSGRRARVKPHITDANATKRLAFAQENVHLTAEDWRRHIFSDETLIQEAVNDKGAFVWRLDGTAFDRKHINSSVKNRNQLMLWGCISYNGTGMLVEVKGRIDSQKYVDIICDNLQLSAHMMGLGNDFVFQHDNAPVHTSRLTLSFLADHGVKIMKWPPQSPDINPIEHLWAILKRKVKVLQRRQQQTFRDAVMKAWSELPLSLIHSLIDSIPSRLLAVIESKGYATKY